MILKYFKVVKQNHQGSSLSLPAYGREGQGQHLLFWRRFLRSKKRNSAAVEKSESESEGGQKFLPPNPLPFCPPERSVWRAKHAVNSVQNRFELRSAIATESEVAASFHQRRTGKSGHPDNLTR